MSLLQPALNLNLIHFQRVVRGVLIIGTWLTERRGQSQPCLVLLHPGRPISAGRTIPVVIPLSELWRYAMPEDGSVGDPTHAGIRINEWLGDGLLPGNPHNPYDHLAILDAINDGIRDVIHMPPRPNLGKDAAFGDVTIKDKATGNTLHQGEVANDV